MNQAELDVVIEKHEKWLRDGYGERANLRGANLSYADLSYADLSCANLRGANLSGADLSYA
ncbi:pentapeptide repeat-containing protein, partial [Listeria monocytogenes]|nr:pentapeptide repeat-containing protein [Listeria monocytogenes]